jgi:hypothetical protein
MEPPASRKEAGSKRKDIQLWMPMRFSYIKTGRSLKWQINKTTYIQCGIRSLI